MKDTLNYVQELKDKIEKLEATIAHNKIGYNNLQRKLATALNGRDIAILTTKREKELLALITDANRATKKMKDQRDSARQSRDHLKERYGV